MLENAKKLIEKYIEPGDKIALAVSGGKDSMCLAHLILESSFIQKSDITILNFNHKIRGKESDSDSEFVKNFAVCHGLNFIIKEFDIPALSKTGGKSLETQGRESRYAYFKELISNNAVKFVLTAHHGSDDIESVLMHIFRGSGLNGLQGMDIMREDGIFRPLLKTPKEEIDLYIEKNGIEFVTDSTNSDVSYNRNFVRNELIPLIKTRWPGAERAVSSLKDEAVQAVGILDGLIDCGLIEKINGEVRLSVEILKSNPLSSRYVLAAFKSLGYTNDITRNNIEDVIKLSSMRNGTKIEMFKNVWAIKEYKYVLLTKSYDNISCADENTEKPFKTGKTVMGDVTVFIKKTEILQYGNKSKNPFFRNVLYADKNKIPSDAVIRFRRDGDIFKPYKGGTKKLKKYFIDEKIPLRLRGTIPLLCDGNEVLAVFGFEISDKIKLDANPECLELNVIYYNG